MLSEIQNRIGKLKTTETQVRTRTGERYVEKISENKIEYLGNFENVLNQENNNNDAYVYPPWEYNHELKKWSQQSRNANSQNEREDVKLIGKKMAVLTYNVWFAEKNFNARFEAMMIRLHKIHDTTKLHVICFQEVTPNFVNLLKEESWIKDEFYCSDMSGFKSVTPYGVIILIHRSMPIYRFVSYLLPSNMGRKLMVAELKDENNEIWKIGTVHLESMDNKEIRKAQLVDCILPILKTYDDESGNKKECKYKLLMGDFNIRSHSIEQVTAEKECLKENLFDAWKALKEDDCNAFTMVGSAERIDRILTSDKFEVIDIQRVGYNPVCVNPNDENFGNEIEPSESLNQHNQLQLIHPSDHCGLFSIINSK